jgi:hypothetical protein
MKSIRLAMSVSLAALLVLPQLPLFAEELPPAGTGGSTSTSSSLGTTTTDDETICDEELDLCMTLEGKSVTVPVSGDGVLTSEVTEKDGYPRVLLTPKDNSDICVRVNSEKDCKPAVVKETIDGKEVSVLESGVSGTKVAGSQNLAIDCSTPIEQVKITKTNSSGKITVICYERVGDKNKVCKTVDITDAGTTTIEVPGDKTVVDIAVVMNDGSTGGLCSLAVKDAPAK